MTVEATSANLTLHWWSVRTSSCRYLPVSSCSIALFVFTTSFFSTSTICQTPEVTTQSTSSLTTKLPTSSVTGATKLENKLTSIKDWGQTDYVTIIANINHNHNLDLWPWSIQMQKNQGQRLGGSKSKLKTDGRTRPIAVPCPLMQSLNS